MRVIQVLTLVVALLGVGGIVATAYSPVSEAAAPAVSAPAATEGAAPAEAPVATGTTPGGIMNAAPLDAQAQFPQAFIERSFGKADAPVTLVEYAALTCPHCAHFHATVLPRLKQTYIDKGLLRIVYNDFPFNEIGLKAAMASRCAPVDQYYEFVGALFASQDKWGNPSVGDQLLKQMAGFAGLSPAQYDACVGNNALSEQLLKNRVQATNDLQITSTPTILVQGTLERIVGAQEYSEYQTIIDRQLTKLGIPLPVQAPAPAETTPAPAAH